MKKITMTEILDDLRAADEITRRFERHFWLSSEDFYALYQKGLLDDGENLEEFTLWAGYYEIKKDRETLLHKLSKERVKKLQAQAVGGFVDIVPNEPVSTLAG
jgi:glycogen debranching enzyme